MNRVLLDENLPHALRKYLLNHDTITAAYAGLAGYKTDKITAAVEAAQPGSFTSVDCGVH